MDSAATRDGYRYRHSRFQRESCHTPETPHSNSLTTARNTDPKQACKTYHPLAVLALHRASARQPDNSKSA